MRKLIILLAAAIGAVSLSSCGTAGYLASGYNVDAIKDVILFEPVSKIETIGKGEITVTNDTACVASQDLLLQTIKEYESGLNILSVYVPAGEEEAGIVREGVESLYSQLLHSQGGTFKTASFVVPPSLDEIIERTGNRYGMAVYSYGFSRTGGNYAAQIAKGVGLAILTLGSVYTVPYKDKSNIHIFIIDSEQDCVAWHNHDIGADYNPLKQKHIEKQFKRIFRKFNK